MAEVDLLTLFKEVLKLEAEKDSLELGSPTGGRVKVYGDFSRPEEFRAKLEAALGLRTFAREQLAKQEAGS